MVIQVYSELEEEEQEDGTEDPWESKVSTKLSLTKRTSQKVSALVIWVTLILSDSSVKDTRRTDEKLTMGS